MNKQEQGQIALTIALIIAVVSAISLSVVSRSLTEVKLTQVDESAAMAIRSAEAGIEQGLSGLDLGTTTGGFDGANFTVTVSREGSTGFLSATSLNNGEVAEINLDGSTGLTSMDIYWGNKNDSIEAVTAAVQVIKYQRFSATDYRTVVYAYDPDLTRQASNKFISPTTNPGTFMSVDFGAQVNVPIVAQDILVRVKPLYNKARLGFAPQPGGATLADQFYKISVEGVAGGNVFRKVEAASSSAGLPEVFDMTVYSGTTLSQ